MSRLLFAIFLLFAFPALAAYQPVPGTNGQFVYNNSGKWAAATLIPSGNGGTGVSNTATITLGTSNQNYATLGTGIIKNTTTTGALSNAASADIISLFSTCSGTQYLGADGACHTAASGDTITSPNSTLTVGGTSSNTTLDFNLTNPNIWTGLQTHNQTDTATSTVTNATVLTHDTSGTAAANFGTGLLFEAQDSTTADQTMSAINSIWTTATHASRASQLQFQTITAAGSLTTQTTIDSSGIMLGAGQLAINDSSGFTVLNRTNVFGWAAAAGAVTPASTLDTAFARAAAGVVRLTNGSTNAGNLLIATSSGTVGSNTKLTLGVNGSVNNAAVLQSNATGTTDIPAIFQGTTSQSGDLTEWQNVSKGVLSSISSAGIPVIGLAGTQTGQIKFNGTTSGTLTLSGPATAGSTTITLPGGTTDFSSTGGTSQVVKQTSSGGAFTVAQLAASDLSNGTTGSGSVVLAASPALTGAPTAPTQAIGDNSTDIATDAFVQAQISAQVDMHDPVQAATTTALILSPTYSNGSSGVGATLTAGTVGVLVLDGYTPNLGDRLLVKNQAAPLQNGCYTVTTLGVVVTTDYVLTRCTDFNQVANIAYGDTFPVLQGSTNANQQFTMNNAAFTSVGGGTSASQITFAQTSGGSQLSAGAGIAITGNSVSFDFTHVNAFTGQQGFTASALTFGSTVSWNLATAQVASLTGTSNINFTLSNPTNQVAGNTYILYITQFSTGGQVITWGSAYKFPGGSTGAILSTGNSAEDMIACTSDGTYMLCNLANNYSH